MNTRKFDGGSLPRQQQYARRDRHLLALSGGGYRGLFTAKILALAEAEIGSPIAARFDMIAGTSIGGILAVGLACRVPALDLVDALLKHGQHIFRSRPFSFAGFTSARYEGERLKSAIKAIIGEEFSNRPFADIPAPLVIAAVHEGTGTPRIFRTKLASSVGGDQDKTIDVVLATSAAPTYFAPHKINGERYVDGGIIANAPDLVVLNEALRRYGCEVSECRLLSIGTAGTRRSGNADGAPGKIGWALRHSVIDLILGAQECLAIDQAQRLGLGGFLRIDRCPESPISMDDTTKEATAQLISLAEQAHADVIATRVAEWRRFLGHSAGWHAL